MCPRAEGHHQDSQEGKRVMSRPGPHDEQDRGDTGGNAEGETLQQQVAARRLHRACLRRAGSQALSNTCGYFLVNSCKERGHDRVAVLGAEFMVRPSGGTNVVWG